MKNWRDWFSENGAEIVPVGSRVTCNPPVTDTDEDYLIFASEDVLQKWLAESLKLGFDLDDRSKHYRVEDNDFNSWRGPENVNLIVTASRQFFNRFVCATSIAKQFNLRTKADRVTLFQGVLYGNAPQLAAA